MIFYYLDPVEVNGDEYQNIEMTADKSENNNEINIQNQTRPDSLPITNEVS